MKKHFSEEQIKEQQRFVKDLEMGNVDIVFEGTFEEGIKWLYNSCN